MSLTAHPPTATRSATDTMRRRSRTAGILYLITFVSMPTLALYQGVRTQADFVLGAGSATGVLWAALSEVVVAIAGVGTAVVLFPIAKRQSETAALGFVTSRVLEAGGILLGVVGCAGPADKYQNRCGSGRPLIDMHSGGHLLVRPSGGEQGCARRELAERRLGKRHVQGRRRLSRLGSKCQQCDGHHPDHAPLRCAHTSMRRLCGGYDK